MVHLILQQPCKVAEVLSASFYVGVSRRWHPGFGSGRPAPGSVLLTTVGARQLSWSLCRQDGQVKQHSLCPTPWPHAFWGASLAGWAGSDLHPEERPGLHFSPLPWGGPCSRLSLSLLLYGQQHFSQVRGGGASPSCYTSPWGAKFHVEEGL